MYCTFHFIAFFVIDRTRKQPLLIKPFNFVFIKDLASLSQSKEQAVMAENEEQYTLSNIIYIKDRMQCFCMVF